MISLADNYCNFLVVATNGTTIDIRQNRYYKAYWRLECKRQGWLETYHQQFS